MHGALALSGPDPALAMHSALSASQWLWWGGPVGGSSTMVLASWPPGEMTMPRRVAGYRRMGGAWSWSGRLVMADVQAGHELPVGAVGVADVVVVATRTAVGRGLEGRDLRCQEVPVLVEHQ